jgi:bisphosphoglycerate-dependent phosphoglycerate mutase
MSIVKVNILELASNLAFSATIDEMIANGSISNESEAYVEETEESTRYTEEAQDVFNRWYDYFYDEILRISE